MENKFKRDELEAVVFGDFKKNGSLRESFLQHAADYGIKEIEQLFPEFKAVNSKPTFLTNKVEWVNDVLGKVNKLPFARVKLLFADITEESIRAKGYVKGTLKTEDVFALLKRETEPYTIYKKGKLDRDDILDITDFEVLSFVKETLRMKLDEEIARAIMLGDGRTSEDAYKIDETCIRPIYNDEDFYTIKVEVPNETGNLYKNFIDSVIKERKNYRGSGNLTMYAPEDLVSELLVLEDTNGRKLYKSLDELKSVLRVSNIVTINEMVDLVRKTEDSKTHKVMAIFVNLKDYSVGTNKGGQVTMFDDFDIDYNQQKFLIETRCSGSLTVPYSAMVFENVVTPIATSLDNEYVDDGEDMDLE